MSNGGDVQYLPVPGFASSNAASRPNATLATWMRMAAVKPKTVCLPMSRSVQDSALQPRTMGNTGNGSLTAAVEERACTAAEGPVTTLSVPSTGDGTGSGTV